MDYLIILTILIVSFYLGIKIKALLKVIKKVDKIEKLYDFFITDYKKNKEIVDKIFPNIEGNTYDLNGIEGKKSFKTTDPSDGSGCAEISKAMQ